MPSLEQVVRPFQSPGVINDKKVRVTRVLKVATERAIITWGAAGDAPETKQVGIKVTVKGADVQKPYKEKSRKTTDVDVTNPDDTSQKVTVRRIDEIQFTRPKPFSDNKTGQPTNTTPANQGTSLSTPPASLSTSSANSSKFNDGSTGTTISKTDSSGGTTTFVDDNTNVTATSNAGTAVTTAEKRIETDTFTLKWDDTGAGA